MERVITNETAQADWKVKWGGARTAFSILCFWQIRVFTRPKKMRLFTRPKRCTFHSAQKMCIFSWPKRCTFSLGPKDLCFQSAKNIYISTQPKRYTVGLAQQMPVFTRPKICMFSANLQSVQASAFSFNQISSRSYAFAFSHSAGEVRRIGILLVAHICVSLPFTHTQVFWW